MNTHKTRGIVLKTVKYGESSIITTVYTELFGIQSYIVKGVRQSTKKSQGKAIYFQPAAVLDLVVYHNPLKNLNFIKEYDWAFLYTDVLFDVVKNTVAVYIIELLQHSLKQPEENPDLFYMVEQVLQRLDKAGNALTANIPLYFSIQLTAHLGFRIHGQYNAETCTVLDLQDGLFCNVLPGHSYYLEGKLAEAVSQLLHTTSMDALAQLHYPREMRRELILVFQNYIALHVHDFGEIKSLPVLQELFG